MIIMMAGNKEQRVCVKFCFLLGKSAAETVLMLQEAFKEEALSKTQVHEWYSHFKRGEMSCEDQPRSGRHSTCWNNENLEKVRNTINAYCHQTIDKISEITGLSWSSCQWMLTRDLNMKCVSTKFVPQLLTEDQKNNHFTFRYDLREQVGNDPQILSKVVTEDQTWCYGYDPETKQASSQWKTPNSPKPKKAQQVWSNIKSCWLVFLMLMELCTRNLFLLDKLWINNFICRCWKDYAIVYGKNDQKCGAAVIGSFTTTMPLPTRPWVCSNFWQKTTWWLSLILPTHQTLCHATLSCSLIWNVRQKENVLLMSAKWKRKWWRSWTTSAVNSSRNVFSSGKNVGKSVWSRKESTLKETRVVIV